MAIFNIAPINSLSFIKKDDLLGSFNNTTYQDITTLARKPYGQMVNTGDVVTVQVKTDYDSVTAQLYNVLTNTYTSLTETETATYTNFSFWEIPVPLASIGFYKVLISGLKAGSAPANYESEMIEVRDAWEGVRVDFYNSENTPYVDYTNNLIHFVRVNGIVRFSDVGGKEEFYNNLGTEERVYSEDETIYDLAVENIPYYLARQLIYGSRLDVFKVNEVEYIVKEHSLSVHPGSHNYDLTLKMTQKEVVGINADADDWTYTWTASTSGDGITITNEVITIYADHITVIADLNHTSSGAGVPLTAEIIVHVDDAPGITIPIAWNNGGSMGLKTIPLTVYPGKTYNLDYSF